MPEDQDALLDRLVTHFEGLGKVVRRGPGFTRDTAMTRRAFVRYGGGAVGLLEIQTVTIAADPRIQWQIPRTRKARSGR